MGSPRGSRLLNCRGGRRVSVRATWMLKQTSSDPGSIDVGKRGGSLGSEVWVCWRADALTGISDTRGPLPTTLLLQKEFRCRSFHRPVNTQYPFRYHSNVYQTIPGTRSEYWSDNCRGEQYLLYFTTCRHFTLLSTPVSSDPKQKFDANQ